MSKITNFKQYCALVKRYVAGHVDETTLHEMYIDWKKCIRVYDMSATEDIIEAFRERTLDTHGNCLKRDLKQPKNK